MIADSNEGYNLKSECLNAIKTVSDSKDAEIEDLTKTPPVIILKEPPPTSLIDDTPQTSDNSNEATDMEKEDQMLAELKKIREAVEKAPPAAPPKGLWNEFKDFLSKYKIFGLAVAFILGLYLGTLIQALVKDLLLPAIGLIIPGMDNLATATVGPFAYGDFLVALITFIIVALIVFIAVKVVKKWKIE